MSFSLVYVPISVSFDLQGYVLMVNSKIPSVLAIAVGHWFTKERLKYWK
jgi:hypothetical protein